jgi:hypothetical protein
MSGTINGIIPHALRWNAQVLEISRTGYSTGYAIQRDKD